MKNKNTGIHIAAGTLFVGGAALAISEKGSLKTAKGILGAVLCTAGVVLEGALITGVLGSLMNEEAAEDHGPVNTPVEINVSAPLAV